MKYVMTILLLFAALEVHAQQTCPPAPGSIAVDAALLCWTNATTDVNGNALPATGPGSLKQTRIQRAQVAATADCSFTTVAQTLNVTPDVLMVLLENLTPGKQCFRIRHVAEPLTAGGAELLSDWTATAFKVTTAPVPPPAKAKPPTVTVY